MYTANVRFKRFRFEARPADVGRRVETLSVLAPLFGSPRSTEDFRRQATRLTALWRERVVALRRCGWATDRPACPERRYYYLANCRPCGCQTAPPSRGCGLMICPHCWARRSRDLWQRLQDALFAPGVAEEIAAGRPPGSPWPEGSAAARPCLRTRYDLVLVERGFRVPRVVGEEAERRPGLAEFLALRNQPGPSGGAGKYHVLARGREVGELTYAGAAETITPLWRRDRPGEWNVRVRQLFAVEPGESVGLYPLADVPMTWERFERPDRRALMRAVARLCRYPACLLTSPPEVVLDFLAARSGRRLTVTHGIFRSVTPSLAKQTRETGPAAGLAYRCPAEASRSDPGSP